MILLGILCALLVAVSSWYSVVYNDARFVAPMEGAGYTFRVKDLPMIISGVLTALYLLYLLAMLIPAVLRMNRRQKNSLFTRSVNPWMGIFGFFGFFGFLGFWTYNVDKTIFPFLFFMFFGFFGFFFEGKMSNTFMDERYRENKMKAHMAANKTALGIIFLAVLILGRGRLMGNLEYTLIAFVIVSSLAIALAVFLSEYLLYRYDHEDQWEESEE